MTNNQAVGDTPKGGGVYCNGGTVSRCVISGNSVTSTNNYLYGAFAEGGGIYAVSGSQIDHSTVINNTLTGYYANGAGINANNGSVQNCTISGNTAYGHWYADGGGVYMTANVDGFIRNCLITGNSAHTDPGGANWAVGGGVYFNSGGILESSTVAGNTLYGNVSNGGGLAYGNQIRNTIIHGNTAATDPNYYLNQYGPATFDHCDSTPLPPGTGNIASDPGFASGYIRYGLAVIDTGINQVWMTTATDLDGNRRIWNGTVDIGAFEFGSMPQPAFFAGEVSLGNGAYYLQFPNGTPFGYYSYLTDPHFIYHFDMGYEYWFDANDGHSGIFFYDFLSNTFFYTSPSFPFPYLYDFSLNTVLYYYPDPNNPGHYTTHPRYFYDFATGQIITK